MSTQTLIPNRELLITETDYDRLKHLMESPRYRTQALSASTLREELARGSLVAADRVPTGVVTMNSRVRVRDLDADETEVYTLVYPDDADIDEGKLSILAPVGTALLGARVGHVVEFDAPAGPRRLKIEKVLYQPEAAGDFHL
jgi:regulator of nucleoside diphosphate kinase